MSFYKQSSEHDPTSPSSLYFNSYNPAKEQSFEEDLVALIGHGHGHGHGGAHGAHAHSGSAGSHHDLGLAHHHQQGAHSNHAGGNNSEQNPSNTMYARPPHDIFGVGSVHPASFPSQSQHQPFHNADPFSHFSQHLSNGSASSGNAGAGAGSGATASSEFRALPSPADSYSALAHRNSLTSRSRSRSKPARSTRGTAASNAPSQIATGIKRDLSSPSPISSAGPGGPQARAPTLPIPISPLNMSIHSVSPPPQPPASSSLHGLAQSLPHSHWSAYLSNTHAAAATPSTPSYLPTPDSYSSFAPSGPFGSVTASSFATTNGMAQSLGAVSTMSTSPPPPPTASTASGKDAGQDDPAAKQRAQLASEKRRRRRESHNAVERRRRDNINEKISELATLIPEIMLDPTAGTTPSVGQALFAVTNGNGGSPGAGDEDGEDGGKDAGPMKANKGMILKKSVEYIRYLQQLVTAQANRNRELESQLTQYRNGQTPGPGSQSAEEMQLLLASPGVMATMYEEPPESARASTESDEDMRPGTGAEEERGRGRAVQRLGVAVKTEDVAMES